MKLLEYGKNTFSILMLKPI